MQILFVLKCQLRSTKFSKKYLSFFAAYNTNSSFYITMLLMFVELIQHSILHKVVDDTDDAKIAKQTENKTSEKIGKTSFVLNNF